MGQVRSKWSESDSFFHKIMWFNQTNACKPLTTTARICSDFSPPWFRLLSLLLCPICLRVYLNQAWSKSLSRWPVKGSSSSSSAVSRPAAWELLLCSGLFTWSDLSRHLAGNIISIWWRAIKGITHLFTLLTSLAPNPLPSSTKSITCKTAVSRYFEVISICNHLIQRLH